MRTKEADHAVIQGGAVGVKRGGRLNGDKAGQIFEDILLVADLEERIQERR